jgi:tetratricopeptide (TPR) repeat protein
VGCNVWYCACFAKGMKRQRNRYQFLVILLFLEICWGSASHAQEQPNFHPVASGNSRSALLPVMGAETAAARAAFQQALREGRLLGPAGNGAWELYQLYTQLPVPQSEAEAAKDDLVIALVSAGERVLWAYRRGDQVIRLEAAQLEEGAQLLAHASQLESQDQTLQSKAKFLAGIARLENRRYSEGISLLEEAVRLDPDAALSYNALGTAYIQQRRWNEAIANFKAASERAEKWVYPHYNLARLYIGLRHYGEAEQEIKKCIEIESELGLEYSYLHYNLAALQLLKAGTPSRNNSPGVSK